MTTLIDPTADMADSYRALVSEFTTAGEDLIPFPLSFPNDDIAELIRKLEDNSNGIGIFDKFAPNSTYWLIHENQVVGVSNLRHHLTDRLRLKGGHIGFGVRPSFRKRGFGTDILRLTLEKAQEIGITKTLITCDKSNVGSAGVILANGGVLDYEGSNPDGGTAIQRYWISSK
jgi:predicted acetyltransferase